MIIVLVALVVVAVSALAAQVVHERRRQRNARPHGLITDPRRLAAVAQVAAAAGRTDPTLDAFCASVCARTGWPQCFFNLVREDLVTSMGAAGVGVERHDNATIQNSLCALVMAEDRSRVITRSEMARAALGGCLAGRVVAAYAGSPVHYAAIGVGTLAVADSRPRKLTEEATRALLAQLELEAARVEQLLASPAPAL